jgi:DNA-binding beta-propeller fold protein YncE
MHLSRIRKLVFVLRASQNQFCRVIVSCALATVVTACAPIKWDAVLSDPAKLSWPPMPNPKKIEYIGALHQFTPVSRSISTVLFGQSQAGEIVKPVAIAVGGDGRMAIVDAGKRGVHFFIPGQQKYLLLSMAGAEGFLSPVSVIFDSSLNLLVSDSMLGKVFVYNADGTYTKEIAPPKRQPFIRPTGLAYQETDGQYYVVDSKTSQVTIFDEKGLYLTSFGKRGDAVGELNIPTHIASGPDGKIYISDAMNFRAQVFSAQGRFISLFGHHGDGSGDFAMPKGIAVDRNGVIYVAETLFDTIQMFSVQGDYLLSLGSQGKGAAEFWMPSGLFIDRDNKLYVCDTYNKRIQIFQLYGADGGGRP